MIALLKEDIFYFQESSAILKRLMNYPPQENVFNIIIYTEKQIGRLMTKNDTSTNKGIKSYLKGNEIKNDDMNFFGSSNLKKERSLVDAVLNETNDCLKGDTAEISIDFDIMNSDKQVEKKKNKGVKSKLTNLIS